MGLIARDKWRKVILFTGSVTFTQILTLAQQDKTCDVPGAKVGDLVTLGLPAAPTAGISYNAFVSAANVVTIRASNVTAGSITPGATSVSVGIVQLY